MFSPEERARIEKTALEQGYVSLTADQWMRLDQKDCQALYGQPFLLTGLPRRDLPLSRDDKAFLKQNHISPE